MDKRFEQVLKKRNPNGCKNVKICLTPLVIKEIKKLKL